MPLFHSRETLSARFRSTLWLAAVAFGLAVLPGSVWAEDAAMEVDALSVEGSDHEGQATVVLMYEPYPAGEVGSIRAMTVLFDGDKKASLRAGRFVRMNIAPGSRRIEIKCGFLCDQPDLQGSAEFRPNRTYYLALSTGFSHRHGKALLPGEVAFEFTFTSSLISVSEPQAEAILAKSRAARSK